MPLSSLPVALQGLPLMPDDPREAASLIGMLFARFASFEASLSDVKSSLSRQDVVLENIKEDIVGLKTDRDHDRSSYANDREADRRAIEWADAWRRGIIYLLGAVVVATFGAAATWLFGFWEKHH